MSITASDLKTKGVSIIERLLQVEEQVVICVSGKPRYVVVDLARYNDLRESDIAAAWVPTRADVATGRYRREGADAHMARSSAELADVP